MPTLKEIYEGQSNWVFGTNYTQVQPDKDTVIEQEISGIRIKSAVELNNPLIYGNESIRIANRTTSSVEKMKQSTGGEGGDGGLIGQGLSKLTNGAVSSISQARDAVNSKLGIPINLIPTSVYNTDELQKGIEPNTMITIGKIRNDANGTEFGKFLKQTGGGNFRTIGRNIIGQGISLVKDKVRDTLFGSPAGLGENEPTNGGYEYSSVNPYSTTIQIAKNTEPDVDKLQLVQTQASEKIDELKSKTKNLLNKNKPVGDITQNIEYTDEIKYSSTNLPFTQQDSTETRLSTPDSEKELELTKKVKNSLNKKKTIGDSISSNSQLNSERNYSPNSTYSSYTDDYITEDSVNTDLSTPTPESEDELKRKTNLSQSKNKKLDEGNSTTTGYSNELKYSDIVREEATDDDQSGNFTRIDLSVLPQNASSRSSKLFRLKGYSQSPYSPDNKYPKNSGDGGTVENMESLYGITNGSDAINTHGLEGDTENLEALDLIPFWIRPKGGSSVHFRTSITGLTETVSPSWSNSKFFGNPFSFYTYDGVERNVSLTLQMFCYNPTELATMWQKIEFLTKQAYPKIATVKTESNGDIRYANPPIVEFRLGDIYNSKVSFIESLSYTIPDNSNWEIDIDGLQLPKLVDVSITFKFIEQVGDEQTLYKYKRSDSAIKLVNEKRGSQGGSFTGDSQTGGGTQNIGGGETTSGQTPPPKLDNRGIEQTEETTKQKSNNGVNKTPKSLGTGKQSSDVPKDSSSDQTKETTESNTLSQAEKNEKDLKSKGLPDWAVEELKYRNVQDVKKVTDIDGNVGYYYLKLNEVRGTKYEYVAHKTGLYHNFSGEEIIGNKKYIDWVKQNLDDPIGTQPDALKLAREYEDARLEKEERIRKERESKAKEREEKLKKDREEGLKKKEELEKQKLADAKQKREEREANRKANGGVYKVSGAVTSGRG